MITATVGNDPQCRYCCGGGDAVARYSVGGVSWPMIEMGLHLDKIAKMIVAVMATKEDETVRSMTGEEAVTMHMMYRQLMVMSQRLEAFGKDLSAVKDDVHAIKESNKSTSSSNRRVLCPLGCGADFKRVREWRNAVLSSIIHLPTGELFVGSSVQIYWHQ